MTRALRTLACGILALAVLSSPLWSQQCPMGQDFSTQLARLLSEPSAEAAAADIPLKTSPSAQESAPSSSAGSASLIDGVGFTDLVGLAVDNDVVSGEVSAFTLNLNAFVLAALTKPQNYWDQTLYEQPRNRWARRFGVAITTGGEGESFDRDGDGEKDEALESEELDDIVTWEARWRFYGSRDRRDQENFAEFTDDDLVGELATLKSNLAAQISSLIFDTNDCFTKEELERAIYANDSTRDLFEQVRQAHARMMAKYEAAATEIDKRMIWTLVVGGTSRKDQFGPDKDMAAIRGAWGANTVNIEWSRTESLTGGDDPEMLKLGWELAKQIFRERLGKDGARLSGSFAYETFDNVPDAMHDTNVKLNTKLEIPITEAIKVPLSLTWANHADLITDEDDISGHFGVTFDTSALWKSVFRGGNGSP